MKALKATEARALLFQLLRKSVKGHLPVRIESKVGSAVLIGEEDYESLLETLELLSTPGLAASIRRAKEEIRRGETQSLEEVFGRSKQRRAA